MFNVGQQNREKYRLKVNRVNEGEIVIVPNVAESL